ncbi:MAG: FadR/GntR family transcriptional regulator [Deltaproteobacteria bacterium]|nr:FadR/GntR family transcriptional regulator [Deltaproteobacteria bacterium]
MFKRISARKISDEIIEQFKEMLNKGELKPGDELPSERDLAEMIGVSRPPLREALNALQTMGFIEIRPRRKIVVRSIVEKFLGDPVSILIAEDMEKLFELLEIRRAMESWVAYNAAKRASRENIRKIEKIIEKDQGNLKLKRDDAKTDADFHVSIAQATENTICSHLMASCYHILWNTQMVSRETLFKKAGNRDQIAQQHVNIFEAIQARDPEKAAREARRHISFVAEELRRMLSAEPKQV